MIGNDLQTVNHYHKVNNFQRHITRRIKLTLLQNETLSTDKSMNVILGPNEGLRLGSGPGRDCIFKLTGEQTGGAFDYFIVEIPAGNGPPLHVHRIQDETFHVLAGRYKVQLGEEIFYMEEGDFAYLPKNVPHAFKNISDEPGRVIVVYSPGGGHKFFEEFGPIMRNGRPERAVISQVFENHDMTLIGPPLNAD
jgi:quercetin dioxygenase-like cupin family protein